MKKIFALLMVLCLLLSACGGSAASGAASGASSEASSEAESAAAPKEAEAPETAESEETAETSETAETEEASETPEAQETSEAEEAAETEEAPDAAAKTRIRLGLLAGPTGMGAAKLLQDAADGVTVNDYQHTLFNAPDEVTAKIISGELDIAAVPTNLAAVLYQKTNGGVQLLALNTLGVLHLITAEGETVGSVEDLKGKTIYSSGQAAVPEYVLNYILDSAGILDEVEVIYEAEHDAVIAALASGTAKIAVLPEPKVTAAMMQVDGLTKALDLTAEWDKAAEKAGNSSVLSMGCVVVRTDFASENPDAVEAFLSEYKASIDYMKDGANLENAAALCEQFGIIPKAPIAMKALPGSNLYYADGAEMKEQIAPFYEVLFNFAPASVGGALPDDGFYYGI